jgi:excinuclease UvrABC helicase subunit UvrB
MEVGSEDKGIDFDKIHMSTDDKTIVLEELRKAMLVSAEQLEFEKAAKIRDEIIEFEKDLDNV